MDWLGIFALFMANAGLILWMRSESRADIRHMDSKLEANRDLVNAIHMEMKDFHNKLYSIEERRLK